MPNPSPRDIAGALAELEGECVGNPSLLAGESITLGMAGMPFDGYYVCSAARHVFEPDNGGYTTWVTVGGFRDRSLYALSSGAGPADSKRPDHPGTGDRHRRQQHGPRGARARSRSCFRGCRRRTSAPGPG